MNESIKMPSEVKQIFNFFEGRKKLKKLPIPSGLTKTILNGLLTLIPEEIHHSKILERPKLTQVVFDLLQYQLRLNDRLDFEGANKEVLINLVEETKSKEKTSYNKLESSVKNLEEKNEAHKVMKLIDQMTLEVEFIEKHVRSESFELTVNSSLEYRRLVNAINNLTVITILFGESFFDGRLKPITKDEMSYQEIQNKYLWMFENNPRNKLERTIMIMERATTIYQIDDDKHGYQIDRLLNIPSIAAGADKEFGLYHMNEMTLSSLRKRFLKETIDMGLGILPTKGTADGFKMIQWFGEQLIRSSRRNKHLLENTGLMKKISNTSKLPLREKAFIQGKI